MNMKSKLFAMAILGFATVYGNLANAAPPTSVTGRWSILGNQSSGFLDLVQTIQANTCRAINGTIYPGTPASSAVRGYYCPSTGRIAFARKNAQGIVNQTWVGNVSDVVFGAPLRMGGTFHALDTGAGSGILGEYHFQGQK